MSTPEASPAARYLMAPVPENASELSTTIQVATSRVLVGLEFGEDVHLDHAPTIARRVGRGE